MPEDHSETSKHTNSWPWVSVLSPKMSPMCPYYVYMLHLSELCLYVQLRPILSMIWFWVFCYMQQTILTRGQDGNRFPGRKHLKLSCFSLDKCAREPTRKISPFINNAEKVLVQKDVKVPKLAQNRVSYQLSLYPSHKPTYLKVTVGLRCNSNNIFSFECWIKVRSEKWKISKSVLAHHFWFNIWNCFLHFLIHNYTLHFTWGHCVVCFVFQGYLTIVKKYLCTTLKATYCVGVV